MSLTDRSEAEKDEIICELTDALLAVCQDESDGHGSYVADEFQSHEVLKGRVLLDKLGINWRNAKYRRDKNDAEAQADPLQFARKLIERLGKKDILNVQVGSHHTVIIEKMFGPMAAFNVKVEMQDGEWVVFREKPLDVNHSEMDWVEMARWDCQLDWMEDAEANRV